MIPRHEIEVLEQLLRSHSYRSQRRSDVLLGANRWREKVACLHWGRSQGLNLAVDHLRALLDKYEDEK